MTKYLIYISLIIVSYQLANVIAGMLQAPMYLLIFMPMFLVATIIILFSKSFFKRSTLFQNLFDMIKNSNTVTGFIFWILLASLLYVSLSFFDIAIEKVRKTGYTSQGDYIRKNIAHYYNLKHEAHKDKVFTCTKEEALALVKKDGSKLRLLSATFKKDKEIVYEAVKQNPYEGLNYAHTSFQSDRKLLFMAVEKNGNTLCMADTDLRKNKELVFTAIHAKEHTVKVFSCADQSFWKNKKFVLAAIQTFPLKALHMADRSLKKDREVVLASVSFVGTTLCFADDSLKKDRELVLIAVKQSGYALEYVDKSLKNDREIVLTALKSNGGALRYATSEQQADKELVLVAVKNDDEFHEALKYASIHLIDDKEIALAAVKHNGFSLRHISMRLKHDKEIIMEAIKQNKKSIVFVPKSLQKEFQ